MKDFFKNIQTLLVIVLVGLLLYQRSCSSTPIPEPKVITEIEVRYDTVKTIKETYIPKWRTKTETIHDTVPADIDTLSILKDYYAKYYYSDTIKIDTVGYAIVNDTITRNTILARDVKTNIIIPTIHIKKTIYINQRELYWGVGASGQTDQLNYLGGELMYRNKNKQAYGFGIGVNQDLQPVFTGRMYWKIGK